MSFNNLHGVLLHGTARSSAVLDSGVVAIKAIAMLTSVSLKDPASEQILLSLLSLRFELMAEQLFIYLFLLVSRFLIHCFIR